MQRCLRGCSCATQLCRFTIIIVWGIAFGVASLAGVALGILVLITKDEASSDELARFIMKDLNFRGHEVGGSAALIAGGVCVGVLTIFGIVFCCSLEAAVLDLRTMNPALMEYDEEEPLAQ
eukprot:m51a1_g6795 hypothetical protein (121) ;mRNA; r:205561-206073